MKQELIDDFLDYLTHERVYSPHTVTSYGNDLREFDTYLKNPEDPIELPHADADLVRGWAMELMVSGMKATSVNRKLSSLRTFYKYLLKKGEIEVSPMQNINGPKKAKPLPQFVREADMERLLCATAQGETWQEAREHVILQLFYETGKENIPSSIPITLFADTTIETLTVKRANAYTVLLTVIPTALVFGAGIFVMIRRKYS